MSHLGQIHSRLPAAVWHIQGLCLPLGFPGPGHSEGRSPGCSRWGRTSPPPPCSRGRLLGSHLGSQLFVLELGCQIPGPPLPSSPLPPTTVSGDNLELLRLGASCPGMRGPLTARRTRGPGMSPTNREAWQQARSGSQWGGSGDAVLGSLGCSAAGPLCPWCSGSFAAGVTEAFLLGALHQPWPGRSAGQQPQLP